jgi:uncharacterized membrane protein
MVTAIALYFGLMQHLPSITQWIVQGELSEDPNDFIATRILSLASIAPTSGTTFYTVYFAAHGFLHVTVVAVLLSAARWAKHAAIFVLSLFVIYQLLEWSSVGEKMLLVLTAIDLAVI